MSAAVILPGQYEDLLKMNEPRQGGWYRKGALRSKKKTTAMIARWSVMQNLCVCYFRPLRLKR
jgi:hypothetical protein